MKVLITGGCGFIGSHLTELLTDNGYEVVIVDDLSTGSYRSINYPVTYYEMDFTSKVFDEVFEKEKPDYVIHLAAQVDVKTSMENPIFDADINLTGTIKLLQLCRRFKVKRIIFASTSAVYGDLGNKVTKEESPLQPVSFYGVSKLASEMYILQYHHQFGLPYTIFRYSNVYGPRQRSDNEGGVIPVFIKQLASGKNPVIFGDGNQTRDFIHVRDVARANLLALQAEINDVMNISSRSAMTINHLYNLVSRQLEVEVTPEHVSKRRGDILFSTLDNTKAKALLGWNPQYQLDEGIHEMIETIRSVKKEGNCN